MATAKPSKKKKRRGKKRTKSNSDGEESMDEIDRFHENDKRYEFSDDGF